MPTSSLSNKCQTICSSPIAVFQQGNVHGGDQCAPHTNRASAWLCAASQWNTQASPFCSNCLYPHASYCFASITMTELGGEWTPDTLVCAKQTTTTQTSSKSCCPKAIYFEGGCTTSLYPIGTRFLKETPPSCGVGRYRWLGGTLPTGSSLDSFPLIYTIASRTATGSKNCYTFGIYNHPKWSLTSLKPNVLPSEMTECLTPFTEYTPPIFPPPPTPPPTTGPSHHWCWTNPRCCWNKSPANWHQAFIALDRETGLPYGKAGRGWPAGGLGWTGPCMNFWAGPFPFNQGHNLQCRILRDVRNHMNQVSQSYSFNPAVGGGNLWRNHPYRASLTFKSYDEMKQFERLMNQTRPGGKWMQVYFQPQTRLGQKNANWQGRFNPYIHKSFLKNNEDYYDPYSGVLTIPITVPRGIYPHENPTFCDAQNFRWASLGAGGVYGKSLTWRITGGSDSSSVSSYQFYLNFVYWQKASFVSCTPSQVQASKIAKYCPANLLDDCDPAPYHRHIYHDNWWQKKTVVFNPKYGIYGWVQSFAHYCDEWHGWEDDNVWGTLMYYYNLAYYNDPPCPYSPQIPATAYPNGINPCQPAGWPPPLFPYKNLGKPKVVMETNRMVRTANCSPKSKRWGYAYKSVVIDVKPAPHADLTQPAPAKCGDIILYADIPKLTDACRRIGGGRWAFIAQDTCALYDGIPGLPCQASSLLPAESCLPYAGYGGAYGTIPGDSGISHKCYRACSSHHATWDKRPGGFRGGPPAQGPQAIWKYYWKEIPCVCSSA